MLADNKGHQNACDRTVACKPLSAGTKTQKAKGIPDNAEIFTQDILLSRENVGMYYKGSLQGLYCLIPC